MSRAPYLFKQKDVVRAMRSAEKGGLVIGHVEVVTKDGTTIRVFGPSGETPKSEWDEALAK
jgi:hypothetical protein